MHQDMDNMDVDQIVDVPDTPDRLTPRVNFDKSDSREGNHHESSHCHSGRRKIFEEVSRDLPIDVESGRKRMIPRHVKGTGSSSNPVYSNKNSEAIERPSRRNDVVDLSDRSKFDKSGSREGNHNESIHCHSGHCKLSEVVSRDLPTDVESGRKRMITRRLKCTGSSSNPVYPNKNSIERPSRRNDVVDLSDWSMHRPVFIDNQREVRNGPALANGTSCSQSTNMIPVLLGMGGEGANSVSRAHPTAGNGEGLESSGSFRNKPANSNFVPLDSTPSPVINKQKRLVRNGCISPNNITKTKHVSRKEENASVVLVQNAKASTCSSAPSVSVDIMDLVAEDNNSRKGKGKAVLSQPCPSNELNAKNKHLLCRSSLSLSEKLHETNGYARDVSTTMEESSGWRSTRNRHRKTNIPVSDEDWAVVREANYASYAGEELHNRRGRSDKDTGVPSSQCSRQSESNPSALLRRLSSHKTTSTHPVRLKPRSSSSLNECSTSARNDPEVVLITSPGEPSTTRLTSRMVNNSKRVIEVERSTPELRDNSVAEEARMRQLEADERLACELQEQLYNEAPALEAGEFDEHIALALQQQDDSAHVSSRSTRQRGSSLISDLHRESQLRSSNAQRSFQSRVRNVGRTTRPRSRFPGVPRSVLPSTGRASVFPADMDIDMRMHILGTLEAFSDMGVAPSILQTQRDFNENDYEMLLALDENNDRHGGASVRAINGLPESTVQSDNYDEACAVCLETPTIGDTIRHLPCLHKFHKDCIDPWLRRKTSCPVCKSSIT